MYFSFNNLQLVDSALCVLCNIIESWEKIDFERNGGACRNLEANSSVAVPAAAASEASNGSADSSASSPSRGLEQQKQQQEPKRKEYYFCKVLHELVALFRRERQLGPERTAYIIRCSRPVIC